MHTHGFIYLKTERTSIHMLNYDDFSTLRNSKGNPKTQRISVKSQFLKQFEDYNQLILEYGVFKDLSKTVENPKAVTTKEFAIELTANDLKLFALEGLSLDVILNLHGLESTEFSKHSLKLALNNDEFRKRIIKDEPNLSFKVHLIADENRFKERPSRIINSVEDYDRFTKIKGAVSIPDAGISYDSQIDYHAIKLTEQLIALGQFTVTTPTEKLRQDLMDLRNQIEILKQSGDLNRIKAIYKHALSLNPELYEIFEPSSQHLTLEEITVDQLANELIYGIESKLRKLNHIETENSIDDEVWSNGYDQGYRAAMKDLLSKASTLSDLQRQALSDVLGESVDVIEDNSIVDESASNVTITLDNQIL